MAHGLEGFSLYQAFFRGHDSVMHVHPYEFGPGDRGDSQSRQGIVSQHVNPNWDVHHFLNPLHSHGHPGDGLRVKTPGAEGNVTEVLHDDPAYATLLQNVRFFLGPVDHRPHVPSPARRTGQGQQVDHPDERLGPAK